MMNYKMALAVLWFAAFTIFMLAVYFGKHPENAVSTTMLYALGGTVWGYCILRDTGAVCMKSYTELCTLPTYEERLEYLQLHGEVGRDTFGFDRWLNQDFYQSREWRQFRDRIIARDMGCDLGCKDHPITDWVLRDGKPIRPRISIHHINPITKDDVLQHSEKLLDPENAICVSAATHKAIHYGTGQNKNMLDGERKPGDTCPWRK